MTDTPAFGPDRRMYPPAHAWDVDDTGDTMVIVARRAKGKQGRGWDRSEDEWQPSYEPRRRRDRRERRRGRGGDAPASAPVAAAPPLPPAVAPVVAERTCGRCREYVADDISGRGECLHPGSGVLRPWWDTPACPFFA